MVYKLLSIRSGFMYSAVVDGRECVQYEKHRAIEAPPHMAELGYHLLVFEGIDHALSFLKKNPFTGELWSARAEGIIKRLPPMRYGAYQVLYCDKDEYSPHTWPEGTIMVKKMYLEKKLLTIHAPLEE